MKNAASFKKINLALLVSASLITCGSISLAQETLKVSSWASNVEKNLNAKNSKELSALLDLNKIEKNVTTRKMTEDRETMEKARELFGQEKFAAAIENYNKVSKDSDFWLESVEEKAWAYYRMNQVEKALANIKTLTGPVFSPVAGSEAFFLQSLAHLKICDYKSILSTHEEFKKTQRDRIQEMQNLADGKASSSLTDLLAKADEFPLTVKSVGQNARLLPKLFFRDQEVLKAALQIKMAEAGLPVLKAAASKTKEVQKAIAQLESNQKSAQLSLKKRIKELAQAETNDNFKMIQKINLIEVETIQRVHTDQANDVKKYAKSEEQKVGADDLVFVDDGHPWIDEVDKYQMQVNSCPSLRRRM